VAADRNDGGHADGDRLPGQRAGVGSVATDDLTDHDPADAQPFDDRPDQLTGPTSRPARPRPAPPPG
jgi:hypothetical protein